MGCCQKIIHGAVALAKVALGADAASDPLVAARRDICRQCDQATRNSDPRFAANRGLTTFSRCRKCSCFIAAKTRLTEERCPLGRW
ncbi:MAG: hypothetical protein BWX88_04864 [Planctomycetes bacterium ADurb.Bin126]|nr:MAG: hypothetical protein BWX88_04864 [Planctomycetes bacterium ADurb.Bin126]HOD83729.1 hypothetical protein [Phycisphaerae bacterium]